MTPKEKALELIDKYKLINFDMEDTESHKECALIACQEVIEQWDYIDTYIADLGGKLNPNLKYWLQVNIELKKL
jgi:hypothetical protein